MIVDAAMIAVVISVVDILTNDTTFKTREYSTRSDHKMQCSEALRKDQDGHKNNISIAQPDVKNARFAGQVRQVFRCAVTILTFPLHNEAEGRLASNNV